MASVALNLPRPTVGLLNIGTEEIKGHEEIREAGEMLRSMNLPELDYIGFVEGDGIGKGAADVIVTEGFSGNIATKAAEGTARQMSEFLRAAMARTWRSKLGYLFARSAFRELRDKLDPRKSNGGVLLGLNGVVVKSHGGTDAEGFAYAVDVGYEMVRYNLLTKINQMLNREGGALECGARGGCLVTLRSVVLGCGAYLPQRILTNAELASQIDTSDEWIVQRTGIRERHIAADDEFTSHLAIKAANAALANAGIDAQAIDLIVLATSTPDNTFPGDRRCRAERPRHHPWRGLRPAGGVLGLRVCAGDRRQFPARRARSNGRW